MLSQGSSVRIEVSPELTSTFPCQPSYSAESTESSNSPGCYTGNLNVEIAGQVRPRSYEVDDRSTRRFFVMRSPEVRGMKLEGDRDLELLKGLSYAILNKTRLSYIYDFNEAS